MAQGIGIYESNFVDALEAQQHIVFLVGKGIAIRHIASLAKSDKTTIHRIKSGARKNINKPLNDRLLAISTIMKSPGILFGSEDVVAMVKELKQVGVTQPMIAEAIGIPSKQLNLRRNITQRRRDAIARFHAETMNGLNL